MNTLKKVLLFLRKVIEEYIPVCSFLIMFAVFIIQIVCRRVFKVSVPWTMEVTSVCFLWTVVLGSCYTQRQHSHVMFTLIYDSLKPRLRAFSAFLGELIILVALCFLVVPTYEFVQMMEISQTSILKISLDIVYMPIIPFLLLNIGYMLADMYKMFMVFSGLGGENAIARMMNENQNETEAAVAQTKNEEGTT